MILERKMEYYGWLKCQSEHNLVIIGTSRDHELEIPTLIYMSITAELW